MDKHEMTAREFVKEEMRMCRTYFENGCYGCPLLDNQGTWCRAGLNERIVAIVEKWAAEHPEETFEQVGDNIYFDLKHRIVADEVTRVFTVEITQIGATEHNEEYLKSIGQAIAEEFAAKAYPFNIDNVRCIRAQQFITKCHEEEI